MKPPRSDETHHSGMGVWGEIGGSRDGGSVVVVVVGCAHRVGGMGGGGGGRRGGLATDSKVGTMATSPLRRTNFVLLRADETEHPQDGRENKFCERRVDVHVVVPRNVPRRKLVEMRLVEND